MTSCSRLKVPAALCQACRDSTASPDKSTQQAMGEIENFFGQTVQRLDKSALSEHGQG
eukprot:CAMPEP_0206548292 /NCGR_PEP_ID=MMETSP0325_2-20121206/13797_1 /ASSEMBLY_ACC=CAM_ASM_000347 /TAXON_ID=2866 /ORGANISM="Crypthecodinium cohnii, Strain Seligo" /LENGTH=57 /DNA_ID=CAMNT_0054047745 /DNA_START=386 /DNA_END=559 /DNA_ORIENTATION=+